MRASTRSLLVFLFLGIFVGLCMAQSGPDAAARPFPQPRRSRGARRDGPGSIGPLRQRTRTRRLYRARGERPQDIQFFSPGGRLPLAVALLVDHSQSMMGDPLACAKTAAAAFLERLHPDDLVEVLAFNELPVRLYDLGPDHPAARDAIMGLAARGMTRLYDAVLVALRDLERAGRDRTADYQNAIVIVSDGEDTRSYQGFEDLLDDAKRSTATIYALSMRADERHRSLPPVHELTQLAFETGGDALAVKQPKDLDGLYEQIGATLGNRYRIGYVPPSSAADGRWHRISVRTGRGDLVVRTRAGYFSSRQSGVVFD
jgi:VWFA-related protein